MRLQSLADSEIPENRAAFYDDLARRIPGGLQVTMYRDEHQVARFRRILELIKKMIPERESCLEIGCGEGLMTRELAGLFQRVDAVDVSQVMISRRPQLSNVRYHVGDAERWQTLVERYDLVVLSEVLEHLRDPARAVREYARVGRYLLATAPVTEQINPAGAFRADLILREQRPGDATGHIWAVDYPGFLSWFAGLQLIWAEQFQHCGIVIAEREDT